MEVNDGMIVLGEHLDIAGLTDKHSTPDLRSITTAAMANQGSSHPIEAVSNPDDVEKSASMNPPSMAPTPPTSTSINDELGLEDNSNIPRLSYLKLFWFFFYNFGLFAWGGPVAQIALIKDRLVLQDKWISLPRFQRVFSVYQILPGPEAAELCMFFGCLSAGRIGGILAGVAFMLPGFLLMLLASYLYSLAGFENTYFNASFRALQPIVAAMVGHLSVDLSKWDQGADGVADSSGNA